jgi:polyisoprenoid-binding protein YceI
MLFRGQDASFQTMRIRILIALSLCFGFALYGADKIASSIEEVTADTSKSDVQFALSAVLHTVHGSFKVKSGTVRLDVATGRLSGQIIVDLNTGDSGVQERDRHMREDVLESERFPEAVFSPDRLSGRFSLEGESQVGLHGILRIHGQDHEITVPAAVKVHEGHLIATAKFVVPYVKWGMKDPSTFVLRVSDKVDVSVSLVGTVRPPL